MEVVYHSKTLAGTAPGGMGEKPEGSDHCGSVDEGSGIGYSGLWEHEKSEGGAVGLAQERILEDDKQVLDDMVKIF
jgi:hypothetical protein